MKAIIVLGTRPEIIKMAPIMREMSKNNIDSFILHTGQHYSYELDKRFFEDLELDNPKYNLRVGSKPYRQQIGEMVRGIRDVLKKEKPDVVLVQGDTNSVLAGALAAAKEGVKIGHVEAGLRSHDLTMIEEKNRIITDHISDFLFAPTEEAAKNLFDDNIHKSKIHLTGNTIVDSVLQNVELARKKVNTLKDLGLKKNSYVLVTAHRAENVDNKERLKEILDGLNLIKRELGLKILFPLHPRTKKMIEQFGLNIPRDIIVTEPLGFLEFLQLEENARLILTDSGGLQEEACILKVPCVTMRDNTERPETVKYGMNILSGTDAKKIVKSVQTMLDKKIKWTNPFGDGNSSKKIVERLKEEL